MKKFMENLTIYGAKLIFRNFSGKPGDYNKEGDRNFGVLIPDDMVETLQNDGWRIRFLKPNQDGYSQPWLKVNVNYGGKVPPTVVLINSRGKRCITERVVGEVDYVRISNCDVTIRPYQYPAMPGRPEGVSAYLSSIYITIYEDDLALKYADIPDIEEE